MKTGLQTFLAILFLTLTFSATAQPEKDDDEFEFLFDRLTMSTEPASITFKLHLLRFLYGPNLGVDVKVGRNTWVGAMYNYHFWDYVTVGFPEAEYMAMEALPKHQRVDGHTVRAHLIFQKEDSWGYHGPAIGFKQIVGTDLRENTIGQLFETSLREDREQYNLYLNYTFGMRKPHKYFGLDIYFTTGLVYVSMDRRQTYMGDFTDLGNRTWLLPFISLGGAFTFGL